MEPKTQLEQQTESLNEIEEIMKKWVVMSNWKKDLESYNELSEQVRL